MPAKAVLRPEVESFYSFSKVVVSEEQCRGLACYVARSLDPRREKSYPGSHLHELPGGQHYGVPGPA